VNHGPRRREALAGVALPRSHRPAVLGIHGLGVSEDGIGRNTIHLRQFPHVRILAWQEVRHVAARAFESRHAWRADGTHDAAVAFVALRFDVRFGEIDRVLRDRDNREQVAVRKEMQRERRLIAQRHAVATQIPRSHMGRIGGQPLTCPDPVVNPS